MAAERPMGPQHGSRSGDPFGARQDHEGTPKDLLTGLTYRTEEGMGKSEEAKRLQGWSFLLCNAYVLGSDGSHWGSPGNLRMISAFRSLDGSEGQLEFELLPTVRQHYLL